VEHLTTFIASRGIIRSCRLHNSTPISSHSKIDYDFSSKYRSGDSIYICSDALIQFSRDYFPQLNSPCVLVSGDSDLPINAQLLDEPNVRAMLESENLSGWFAQNLAVKNKKLSSLPIGLDYHTMWERPGLWGLSRISPLAQEHALLSTLATSKPLNQRYLTAYCNWHFALHRGDRQECINRIDKTHCYFEAGAIPRLSTWQRQAECMFVISPHGAGLDCHRTWEALLLGCIPIIKTSPLDSLFSKLPVLILSDWSELTREMLMEYAQLAITQKFDFSSLFREHWLKQINGTPTQLLPTQTMVEFRHMLTSQTA
jgi:hypothetical protein